MGVAGLAQALRLATRTTTNQAARGISDLRPPRPSLWRRFLRTDPVAVVALVVVTLIALAALAAPILPLANPDETNLSSRLLPPFQDGHVLGTINWAGISSPALSGARGCR